MVVVAVAILYSETVCNMQCNMIFACSLLKLHSLKVCLDYVIQAKLNIQKLRDTHKTLAQSVGQGNALLNNEVTEEPLRATPSAVTNFSQVQRQI